MRWRDLKGCRGKIGHWAVDNTPVPTTLRATATLRHRPCPCCGVPQTSPISPAGPEIPLSSYPPAAPPAPIPVDSKAGPSPPQPGFTPMAMYPPPGPAAQYPMYPSGPPVYYPTGEHRGGTGTLPVSQGAWWPRDTLVCSPLSTTSLRPGTAQLSWSISPGGDPCTRRRPAGPSWGPLRTPLALGGCPSQRWIRLFLAILG